MEDKLKELQTQRILQRINENIEECLGKELKKQELAKKLCDNMKDPMFIWNFLGHTDSETREKYLGWLNLCLILGADPGDKYFVSRGNKDDGSIITYFNPLYR